MSDEVQDFQKIGDLISKLDPTARSGDIPRQRSTSSQPTSPTTSPTGMAETSRALIGPSPGNGGFGRQMVSGSLQDFLTGLGPEPEPEEIDRRMEDWLPRSLVSSIVKKPYMGSDPGYLGTIIDYELRGYDGDGRDEAIDFLEALSRPADKRECVKELVRVKILTAGAKQEDRDIEMEIEIYASELQRYPLDVVRDVLRNWPRCEAGKWFPTWAEISEKLDERFLKRKALLNALRRWAG